MSDTKATPGKGPWKDETVEEHESFGMVSLSRYTCNPPRHFFGSSAVHNGGVTLRISTASRHRHLNRHSYYAEEQLVEINLTPAQLADLLTSLNMGDGVPCTIRRFNGKTMKPCPEVNERKLIHREFDNKMKELSADLETLVNRARELQAKPSINKTDRTELLDLATTIQAQIANSLPFIHSQFDEAMDATLNEAKADLEDFVLQLTRSAGIESLRQKLSDTVPAELKDRQTCES